MFALGTAVSSASRTDIKQALRKYVLKEETERREIKRGIKEERGTSGLWEGLEKDSRKRQVRKGMVRTSEGRWHQGHGRKLEGNGFDSICALSSTGTLGVLPTALSLCPRGVMSGTLSQAKAVGGRGAKGHGAETGLWLLLRLTPGEDLPPWSQTCPLNETVVWCLGVLSFDKHLNTNNLCLVRVIHE